MTERGVTKADVAICNRSSYRNWRSGKTCW